IPATIPTLGDRAPDSVRARSRYAPASPSRALPTMGRRPGISARGWLEGISGAIAGGAAGALKPACCARYATRCARSRTWRWSASHSGCGMATSSGFVSLATLPWGQEFHQHKKDHKGKNHQQDRRHESFTGSQLHFVGCVTEKAFGKQLAANHHVPAHGEDADQGQPARSEEHTSELQS